MKKKNTKRLSSRSIKRNGKGMKYKYDRESDVLLITLSKEKPDFAEQAHNVITHYNRDGKPIEIEILGASEMLFGIANSLRPKKGAAA